MIEILMIAEADADFRTASTLADRVVRLLHLVEGWSTIGVSPFHTDGATLLGLDQRR